MHPDVIPFLMLAFLAVAAGLVAQRKGARVVLALFGFGGVSPLLAFASVAGQWPVPYELELAGFYCALPFLGAGSILVGTRNLVSGPTAIAFWILSSSAIGVAIYIAVIITALMNLP